MIEIYGLGLVLCFFAGLFAYGDGDLTAFELAAFTVFWPFGLLAVFAIGIRRLSARGKKAWRSE